MRLTEVNYRFIKGNPEKPVLLLLHGAGGNENSLIPIATELSPDSTILSIRGRLIENGMTRFFRHTPDGGFDLQDLAVQIEWLKQTISELAAENDLDVSQLVVVGYSNGANVAADIILNQTGYFGSALFFHPMALRKVQTPQRLNDMSIWMSHGTLDPIVSDENFATLAHTFEQQDADLTRYVQRQSHQILPSELQAAKEWFNEEFENERN